MADGKYCYFVHRPVPDGENRYSLLPAITMDGVIYAKVVEGSFTAELFLEFIHGLLDRMDKSMPQGSVIVLDNARIHKDPLIRQLIEER